MAEYFYFRGTIEYKTGNYVIEKLKKTDLFKLTPDAFSIEANKIVIDSVDKFGSAPLSIASNFFEFLQDVQQYIQTDQTIEYYIYPDGFYRILLKEASDERPTLEFIQKEDPYENKINHDEIIQKLSSGTDLSLDDAKGFIDNYFRILRGYLEEGNKVELPIGSMELIERTIPSRQVKNPQTGEVHDTKEKTVKRVRFSFNPHFWSKKE